LVECFFDLSLSVLSADATRPKQCVSSCSTHAKTELHWPRALQPDLLNEGFNASLDKQRIGGGSIWITEIEHEIDTRQVTFALKIRFYAALRTDTPFVESRIPCALD
jgi:hypothetical protein